jgi:hypothetical protein
MDSKVALLLSREESSMVSCWTNHLGFSKISEDLWRIGTYGYNWLGSIYDLVPEDQLYDEAGDLIVPEQWDGHKIIGLADGEYLEADELVSSDYVDFSPAEIETARDFCDERGWIDVEEFDRAFLRVISEVKPNQRLSKYAEFKGRPVLRTGYSTNPSSSGSAELGIYFSATVSEIWAWDSESGSECVASLKANPDLKSLVSATASVEQFVGPVDWENLSIKGIDKSYGLLLALAWDGEESSKAVAKLLALWPHEIVVKLLGKNGIGAVGMSQIGWDALELAGEIDVDIDEIKRMPIPVNFDEDSVLKLITDAIRRAATNSRRRDSRQRKKLAPFSAHIDTMLAAFLKHRLKGYYPGAGYVVPPSGGASLRKFLTDYVKTNKALPTGKVSVPYAQVEFSSTPQESFVVDFDELIKG